MEGCLGVVGCLFLVSFSLAIFFFFFRLSGRHWVSFFYSACRMLYLILLLPGFSPLYAAQRALLLVYSFFLLSCNGYERRVRICNPELIYEKRSVLSSDESFPTKSNGRYELSRDDLVFQFPVVVTTGPAKSGVRKDAD